MNGFRNALEDKIAGSVLRAILAPGPVGENPIGLRAPGRPIPDIKFEVHQN
jgi:hypothetical protein